jgi:hypothetical protein
MTTRSSIRVKPWSLSFMDFCMRASMAFLLGADKGEVRQFLNTPEGAGAL